FLLEPAVGEQGQAEVADAYQNNRLQRSGAEQIRNHDAELLDIVAEPAGSELAKIGEILAQLGGLHARGLGEGFAGNSANFICLQALQAAEVDAQAIDRLAGNLSSDRFLQ